MLVTITLYDNSVLTISRLQVRNNVRVEEITHIHQLARLCDPMLCMYKKTKFLAVRIQYNTIHKIIIEGDYTELSRGANKT